MTSIAYKDGELAADTLCVNGHTRTGYTRKIGRGPTGELVGSSGTTTFSRRFVEWIESGRQGDCPTPIDDNEGVREFGFVVLTDGTIEQHEPEGVTFLKADMFGCGSGRQVVLGAMAAGASAYKAVEIAIALDCYSGGEITVLKR